ncbi:hypothetical protein BX600DRAFT_449640 [Xylariales sp. PMI_506]|nr:hypothetical protein BX600DRAFT_449640 [Xylariales sp. PMI_506]
MADGEPNLTHEEIWDDSALVNSWNDALEEYKKYHSIHAKGGNVEELLKKSQSNHPSTVKSENDQGGSSAPEGEADHGSKEAKNIESENSVDLQRPGGDQSAFIPAPLLASVRDENLRKLLMSWYYAGYYTGFYEGQNSQQQ